MTVEITKKQPEAKVAVAKSKISSPYNDLDDSVAVARAIKEKGGGACNADQLATFLGYSSSGTGTYNNRISAAKNFGLIQSDRQSYTLTERAERIIAPVMPEDETTARIEAFFEVPLFKSVYENVGGKMLPPEAGMKNLLVRLGVVEERAGPAYRILMDSAEQAGLFKTAGDRTKMIKPHSVIGGATAPNKAAADAVQPSPQEKPKTFGGGGDTPGPIHSAIHGLLRELPPPGSDWPAAKKQRFLSAFKAVLDVVYPTDEEPST